MSEVGGLIGVDGTVARTNAVVELYVTPLMLYA